jgi:hypothetical protein
MVKQAVSPEVVAAAAINLDNGTNVPVKVTKFTSARRPPYKGGFLALSL